MLTSIPGQEANAKTVEMLWFNAEAVTVGSIFAKK